MGRRGGCRHCAWLRNGSICMSEKAMSLTTHNKPKPLFGQKVKIVENFFDPQMQRYRQNVEWNGCFKYTFEKQFFNKKLVKTMGGVSDFLRRRKW